MNYVDLDGNRFSSESHQDRLLKFLYTNPLGRMIMKPLVSSTFSEYAGRFLDSYASRYLIQRFIKHNNIDMTPYKDVEFSSFNDFFTRRIKEGYRPIEGGLNHLISPCDGKISAYKISDKTTFSVKNTEYTLRTLLQSKRLAARYNGGYAIIIRLTVDDYHRYIYPVSGTKSKDYFIKGALHTVNPIANDYTPIYKENSRAYTVLHSSTFGDVVQMEVGALMVGKITNHITTEGNISQGDEKGYFEFGGSTIILLVKKDRLQIRDDLLTNTDDEYETKILQGMSLGTVK